MKNLTKAQVNEIYIGLIDEMLEEGAESIYDVLIYVSSLRKKIVAAFDAPEDEEENLQ